MVFDMVQNYIDTRLQEIAGSSKNPNQLSEVKRLFDQFVDGQISGFEFPGAIGNYLREKYAGDDYKDVEGKLVELAIDADKRLRESQIRFDITDLITPQEHALLQSSQGEGGIDEEYRTDSYKPMILRKDSSVDMSAVNEQRTRHATYSAHGLYFGLGKSSQVKITMEPLDEDGQTIRDPQPLDEQLNTLSNYAKSDNFPFRRD